MICSPTGKASEATGPAPGFEAATADFVWDSELGAGEHGTLIAGTPARLAGNV